MGGLVKNLQNNSRKTSILKKNISDSTPRNS